MTTTAGAQLRAAIIAAIQGSASAASAAGMSLSTWGSTSTPHVFGKPSSTKAQVNRGRLPFIEVITQELPFTWDTQGGGDMVSNFTLRIHVGGADQDAAQQQAEKLMASSLTAIRSTAVNNYLYDGQQTKHPFVIGPLWHTLDVDFTVVNSFDLGNFGQA